ncbi:hypothetical protein KAR91_86510, partial [Candidatus Pacearchaeota archaeon]|nr:hypothetical protein [Candidatus Pacearchaeota archaeon]
MKEENKGLQIKDERGTMTGGGGFSLAPNSYAEAKEFANMLANTDMVPTAYKNKPANILVAVQMGAECGLQPMAALQNIAVINGRPSIYGDAAIALAKINPKCEYIHEYFLDKDGTETIGDDYYTAVCVTKRTGQKEQVRTFSLADAKKAKLLNKTGPWTQYEKRMLQMRSRGFALRDVYPDSLKGLCLAEEAQDIPPHTAGPTDITPPNESIVTPEFDVPAIDTDRSVMVDEDVVDVETGEVQAEAVKPEAAAEESPFEEEVEVVTAKDLVERIGKFINHFEHKNWMPKHLNEINSLDATDQALVMKAYADKGEEINNATPD